MGIDVLQLLALIFIFVFPIVMVGIFTNHKKEMAALNVQLKDSDKQHYQAEITALKKRLEVLEAIVTDKSYQLSSDINQLKDEEKSENTTF